MNKVVLPLRCVNKQELLLAIVLAKNINKTDLFLLTINKV